MDSGVDWNNVLKNSKEAANRVGQLKITGPIGSPGMGMNRHRGMHRDIRGGRPSFAYRNPRPFDFGRYNSVGLLCSMCSAVSVYEHEFGLALSSLIIPSSAYAS